MEVIWRDKYSVGIKEIDNQHKYFIGLMNDLYNAITASKGREELKSLFQNLIEYSEVHFATEEKYFDEFKYEGAAEHKLKHQEMRDEIKRIKGMENKNEIDFYGGIVFFLSQWLDDHLEKMDQKYVECFKGHGLE